MLEEDSLDYFLLDSENSLTLTPAHLRKITMHNDQNGVSPIMNNQPKYNYGYPTPDERMIFNEADLLDHYSFSPIESMSLALAEDTMYKTDIELIDKPHTTPNRISIEAIHHADGLETCSIANALFGIEDVKVEPRAITPVEEVVPPITRRGRRGRGKGRTTIVRKPRMLKIKKYEQDPRTDPTVKNAIAAKINRTRKKEELEGLKTKLAESLVRITKQDLVIDSLRTDLTIYKGLYDGLRIQRDRLRGFSTHIASVKEVLEAVVPALNKKFNNVTEIEMDKKLIDVLNYPGNLEANGEDLKPPSSYFTFHYSPIEGKLRLDYDPDLLDKAANQSK